MVEQKKLLLKCENFCFGYSGKAFSSPVNFSLSEGEVVALMGANGCGKSTLLKTLSGLNSALNGNILVQNDKLVCLKELTSRELAKSVALVRMSGAVPERMTVREFVSLGRSPYAGIFDGRSADDELIIDEAISLLELQPFEKRQIASLSDGERSRVFLAEAVAQQVRILLLDEPNAFLDIPRSHKLFKLLQRLARERNMGIIVSTHSIEYAEKYCDRLMVINEGTVRVEDASQARANGLLDWTESEG